MNVEPRPIIHPIPDDNTSEAIMYGPAYKFAKSSKWYLDELEENADDRIEELIDQIIDLEWAAMVMNRNPRLIFARNPPVSDPDKIRDLWTLRQIVNYGSSKPMIEVFRTTSRLYSTMQGVDQHAQRAHGRRLFADCKVPRHILGDLTRNKRHLADVRLAQAQVADHVQRAVFAHGPAHVQVAVGARRQLHNRVLHIALDMAAAVRHGQQAAGRAAAVHLQRYGVAAAFEHRAHHGGGGQQAAQRGGGHGARFVQALHLAHDGGGIHAVKHHAAVFRYAAQKILFAHSFSSPFCCWV